MYTTVLFAIIFCVIVGVIFLAIGFNARHPVAKYVCQFIGFALLVFAIIFLRTHYWWWI
ncbi:MAG: hypothetical protein ACTIOB_07830 [Leuconostoc falkenbergense]|uniref:hypothetical protein n=1 Tax=Leuconostoc falkenbergense TaxID=2766470 RepID=UPI003F9CE4B4